MPELPFWLGFFGAPLMLMLITAYVFRPSAKEKYREAKIQIFKDTE